MSSQLVHISALTENMLKREGQVIHIRSLTALAGKFDGCAGVFFQDLAQVCMWI
jgi:hypothetical protein